MILTHFLSLVGEWRPVFRQTRTTAMAVCMALSVLCVLRRNTISQRIVLLRAHCGDWSKFYRLFSRQIWNSLGTLWHGDQARSTLVSWPRSGSRRG